MQTFPSLKFYFIKFIVVDMPQVGILDPIHFSTEFRYCYEYNEWKITETTELHILRFVFVCRFCLFAQFQLLVLRS